LSGRWASFDEPIKLPGGSKLVALKDAIAWPAQEDSAGRTHDERSSDRCALRHRSGGE
jgi:hypothetical protein